MNGILPITLEDALAGEFGDNAYGDAQNVANMSLADIALECADAYGELCDIESNLMTFEAATKIKKAKSGKKKVKVTKKKMSAKAAKAAKKSGKVRRITRESDSELDGGTGPLPTTGDTNGLTDSDLDADPDATVEVTSADDYQPEQADITGIEGVDFEVEYEDPMIQELTFEADNLLKKMGRGLQEFAAKVVQFFQKIYYKINDKLHLDEKFIKDHAEEIDDGLKNNGKFILKNFPIDLWKIVNEKHNGLKSFVEQLDEDVKNTTAELLKFTKEVHDIREYSAQAQTDIDGHGVDKSAGEFRKEAFKELLEEYNDYLFPDKNTSKSLAMYFQDKMSGSFKKQDVPLSTCTGKISSSDMLAIIGAKKGIEASIKNLKSAENDTKRAATAAGASSKKLSLLKRGFANCQRVGNLTFKIYFSCRSMAMKIAHAALKEAKDDDEE